MAIAKRVGKLQALSFSVSHKGEDLILHYDPFFLEKTETASNPILRSMSKNAMSFFLRQLFTENGAVSSLVPQGTYDIRGIAASLNCYSKLSLSAINEAATWKSKRVFAIRYLNDMPTTRSRLKDRGPLIAAGSAVNQD